MGRNPRAEDALLLPQVVKRQLAALVTQRLLKDNARSIESVNGRYLWLEDHAPDWSTYIEQAFSPIEPLKKLSDGVGARLLVSACPAPWQISATAASGPGVRERFGIPSNVQYRSRRPFELLSDYCTQTGIPCCDLVPDAFLQDHADRLFLQNTVGLSSEGHALYADVLTKFVVRTLTGASDQGSPGAPRGLPFDQARLISP